MVAPAIQISHLEACRSIESLRSGVPNSTAVRLLGCSQSGIVRKFEEAIQVTSTSSVSSGRSAGILVKGGFGSGKSHTLAHLAELAKRSGFAVSRISINKETPLSDANKLFIALAEAAVLPNRRGSGLYEAVQSLKSDTAGFVELLSWAERDRSLDSRFAAGLTLYKGARHDFELRERLSGFWCGEPLLVSYVKSFLRATASGRLHEFQTVPTRNLGHQRMRFASRLVRAAGYTGWVWLIDEVELVGSYSLLQRLKSYVEIGRMMTGGDVLDCPGVVVVLTITDDFDAAVLRGKGDIGAIVQYWNERCREGREDRQYSPLPGMLSIQKSKDFLQPLDDQTLRVLQDRLRELYKVAYDWSPSDTKSLGHLSSTTVRHHIKCWLTWWDIRRLFPELTPEIESQALDYDYTRSIDTAENDGTSSVIDELLRNLT